MERKRERERQGGAGAHESNGKQEGVNVRVTNNVESPYMDMLVLSSVAKWVGHPRGRPHLWVSTSAAW